MAGRRKQVCDDATPEVPGEPSAASVERFRCNLIALGDQMCQDVRAGRAGDVFGSVDAIIRIYDAVK